MKVAQTFAAATPDELKSAFAGGKLVIYSVARPADADNPVERSGVLATFTFAAPAFGADGAPLFESNPVEATGVGTPGFARVFKADGTTVVADFSAGSGDREVKLSEVSIVAGYPIALTKLALPA